MTETTKEPTSFEHPTNPNIKFWDLPGIGTPNFPDLKAYCTKVPLERYDAFLIFTKDRFTENDKKLAQKIRSMNKRFFFIRTKIDGNVRDEKKSKKLSFNEDAMLTEIRSDCLVNLDGLLRKEDIFLISNHHVHKWDFERLSQAILDALPMYKRESLTFGIRRLSTAMVQRKVKILKDRMWKAAALSAACGLAPFPGLSIIVDIGLIQRETSLYRSQLGINKYEEMSAGFAALSLLSQHGPKTIAEMCKMYSTQAVAEQFAEEFARYIPIVGSIIASGLSFGCTYLTLRYYLNTMEEAALLVVRKAAQDVVDDLE